jgi:nucleotide-binding universal stress UspA family protein
MAIKHILFPIDFSERCGATAPYVARMAKQAGAKITLLNVIQPYWYAPLGEAVPVVVDVEEIREGMARDLSGSFADELAGLTVEHAVEIGDPAGIITQFAADHDVDLIMMPTHGYGPFRQFLLGSVTAKVLHDSACAVWTSAHVEEPPPLLHAEVRTVLCAVQTDPSSERVLKSAAELAEAAGAQLQLVHVIPAPPAWPDRRFDPEFEQSLEHMARRDIGEMQKSLGTSAPLCIVRGDVASAVHESATRHAADLVVIGRGVLQERLGRLRSNAYGIIRQAPCPVLSI